MRSAIARLRAAGPYAVLIELSILALALLAATATLSGMIALFGGGWLGWIYGGGFGVVIQALIIVALRIVTGQTSLAARGFFAGLYAILVGASVLLGYGFWFDLTAGAGLARDTYRAAIGDVLTPLTAFCQAYDEFARTTADLAQYSGRRAEDERQSGGTCGGGRLKGPGPRQRLRERDAATFADFAQHFAGRAGDFGRLVEATRSQTAGQAASNHAAATRAVDSALEDARALALDLRFETFRETIRERLAAATAGFVDPETNERFACPDPGLESKLKALAAARLPALPQARAHLFEATHAASVQRGLHLLTGMAAFDPQRDVLPLAMGLTIDVLLLCLTLAARALQDAPGTFAGLARRLDPARLLPPGHAEAWLKVVRDDAQAGLAQLLQAWGLEDGRWSYLVAPIAGDAAGAGAGAGQSAAEARRLAAVLGALGLVRRSCLRRPAQMPTWWQEQRADSLAGIELLRLYRLSQPLTDVLVLEQIRQVLDEGEEAAQPDDPLRSAGGAIVPLRRAGDEDSAPRPRRTPLRDDAFIDA